MATTSGMLDKLNGNQKETKLPQTFQGMKSGAIKELLERYLPMIAQIIPQHLKAEKVVGLTVHALTKNPKLAECTLTSVIGGAITASALGLELNTPLQQCFLIPYNNKNTNKTEAEFQLGFKGMIDLCYRNSNVLSVETDDVRENDYFDYEKGLHPFLKHKPSMSNRGKLTHAYAIARLKSGGVVFTVMDKSQIEGIRMRSKAGQSKSSPWNNSIEEDYAKMARKTALRSLFNSGEIPYSLEMKYLAADGMKVDMEMFSKDNTGDYDLSKAEEAPAEVVNEPKPVKQEPKQPIQEPVNQEVQPVEPEPVDDDVQGGSVNDEFVKQVKKSLAKQIQTENRKSPAATQKFADILRLNKVRSLSELVEKLPEKELQAVLDILKLTNAEAGVKEEEPTEE